MASILHQHVLNVLQRENIEPTVKSRGAVSEDNLDRLSSVGLKYSKLRDHPLHTSHLWLEGKRQDDGAEGFWRIHDKLYDFDSFINSHPGGKDWLDLTKGTDITEAFESHHLSSLPESLLDKFYIRNATGPRNSPFTFKPNDFYRVLKTKIYNKLETVSKKPVHRSKYITDFLFISYVVLALGAAYFRSFSLGAVSGIILAMTAIAAHNFFHQKDNFRMYYFDFTFMQSRDWRVSHALSHHAYTNTVQDMEISMLEPFLQYLPTPKNFLFRYISWLYMPVIFAFAYIMQYFRSVIQKIISGDTITFEYFLPFIIPLGMWMVTKQTLIFCALMYSWIITISSIYFGIVGINAAHHHPDIFHDGDIARPKDEMDWGVFQLDAVADRTDINGSHFLVLTNFGDHALHHLFPTIDHGLLEHLYPVFMETVKDFGLDWKQTTQLELTKGQYQQLSRTTVNLTPRTRVKKSI